MIVMSLNQAYLFYIFTLSGILIGLLFDIFRILRRSFKTSDIITLLQDILFWMLAGGVFAYTVFKFNNGEIRSYVLLGTALGIVIHVLLFSKIFIKVNVKIIVFLKNIVHTILHAILIPIKFILHFIRKVLFKPISFVFINVRKNVKSGLNKMSKIKVKRIFFHKKAKKASNQEGF